MNIVTTEHESGLSNTSVLQVDDNTVDDDINNDDETTTDVINNDLCVVSAGQLVAD